MERDYYIYALIDPVEQARTGSQLLSIFYVGKGKKSRAEQHEKDERKALREALDSDSTISPPVGSKSARIQYLLGAGFPHIPSITLSSGYRDEQDAYRAEALAMGLITRLLAEYGQPPLGNTAAGHGDKMFTQGLDALISERPRMPLPARAVDSEPEFELRSVAESLMLSTSRRVDWRSEGVIPRPAILVKGTAEAMSGGFHQPLPGSAAASGPGIVEFDDDYVDDSEFVRRGYDPDDPWSDTEAKGRGARYWPLGQQLVRSWLAGAERRPQDLLLAIPGEGGTTVRYAWPIDYGGCFEYYPGMGRWGIPLGKALLDHPARGKCLVEDRDGREVQVLLNYVSGCRVLDPGA